MANGSEFLILGMINRYVAFLRGINLGPHKKIAMPGLKRLFEEWGLNQVDTYLQSGNVLFSSKESSDKLARMLQKNLRHNFGYDVPVLVLDTAEVVRLLEANPYLGKLDTDESKLYYVLLFTTPERTQLAQLRSITCPHESYEISQNCVYLYCHRGYGRAKCNNNFFERKLRVIATTRNNRTMQNIRTLLGR